MTAPESALSLARRIIAIPDAHKGWSSEEVILARAVIEAAEKQPDTITTMTYAALVRTVAAKFALDHGGYGSGRLLWGVDEFCRWLIDYADEIHREHPTATVAP